MSQFKRASWFEDHINSLYVPQNEKDEFEQMIASLLKYKNGLYGIVNFMGFYFYVHKPFFYWLFQNRIIGTTNEKIYINSIISYHKHQKKCQVSK